MVLARASVRFDDSRVQKAKDGFIDPVHIPRNCLDVLAQHLFGMVCDSEWSLADAAALVRRLRK